MSDPDPRDPVPADPWAEVKSYEFSGVCPTGRLRAYKADLVDAARAQAEQQHAQAIVTLKNDLDIMQRLYDDARKAEDVLFGWKDRPVGPAHEAARELRRRLEQAQTELAQRAQERDEAQTALFIAHGAADEFPKLLGEMVMWARCDLHQHGPGLAGGYQGRVVSSQRAYDLGIAFLADYERLQAAHAALQEQIRHALQAPMAWNRVLTVGELRVAQEVREQLAALLAPTPEPGR